MASIFRISRFVPSEIFGLTSLGGYPGSDDEGKVIGAKLYQPDGVYELKRTN